MSAHKVHLHQLGSKLSKLLRIDIICVCRQVYEVSVCHIQAVVSELSICCRAAHDLGIRLRRLLDNVASTPLTAEISSICMRKSAQVLKCAASCAMQL
jgi:hypothetical protein